MSSPMSPTEATRRGRWRRGLRRQKAGFNVVGHFSDTSGIAEATRSTVRCIGASGYPMRAIDVGPQPGPAPSDSRESRRRPYSVTVVHDNVFHARSEQEHYLAGRESRRRTVGYWYWEVSRLPEECAAAFDLVDEVWVPTRFVSEALQPRTSKPVIVVPPSVDVRMERSTNRARFDLPADRFLFLTMASVHSIVERKNPMGVVEAFERAFDPGDDVGLVVKMTDRRLRPDIATALDEVAQRLPIMVVDERLSRDDTLGLMQCCDCYVSLHRGEGFGLPIAESMALGKPVIATAYSGNMDFTNADNSYLVAYDLVLLEEDLVVFPKGTTWAEPKADDAVAHMRSVVGDPSRREQVATAGQEFVRRHFDPSVGGDVIRGRMRSFGPL